MSSKRKSIFDNVKRYSVANGPIESLDDEMLQLESIDQEISKTLSTIHYNLDTCNSIITSKFIPLLERHRLNCKNINNNTRFWKNLFENSLNVSIQVQSKKTISKQEKQNNPDGTIDPSDASSALKDDNAFKKKNTVNGNSEFDSTLGSSILDISRLLQRYKNRAAGITDFNSSGLASDDAHTSSFGRKEFSNVFSSNKNKLDQSDFSKHSVIDENTSTLTYNNNIANKDQCATPSYLIKPSSKSLAGVKSNHLKRTIVGTKTNDPKRQKKDEEETQRRRKSSAIMKKLNLDDSPEEIPKTPELTYLKFSPIKMLLKTEQNRMNLSTANNESTTLGSAPQLPSGLDDDINSAADTGSFMLGKDISSSLYVDASVGLPSVSQTLNNDKNEITSDSHHVILLRLSIFDSSTSMQLASPPISMKFALPKLNIHLNKSPVKELARRYTEDYLDVAVDDDDDDDLDIPKLNSFVYEDQFTEETNNSTTG